MRKFAWTFVLSFFGVLLSSGDQAEACDHCIAKQKAQQQAAQGQCRHVGGSMGSVATRELDSRAYRPIMRFLDAAIGGSEQP